MSKVQWQAVDSDRVTDIAYVVEERTILVRFPDGTKWYYSHCDPKIWARFVHPGTSKGEFIADVLDNKPNGRF